jgi:ADP-heptose:LPS heptosyltransferase
MSARTALRLVVLRALGLGDLLTGVPALRALRRQFPRYEIVLATPVELAAAARATGAVDTLLPASAPGRAVPSSLNWRGAPPDIAVDLHGNGPASCELLRRLIPRRLLAYADPEGPQWDAREHERERWCRLLRWYGIPADPAALRLPRPPGGSPAPGAVVLHPGAGAPARRWPVERYATVAARLRSSGRQVAVVAGPGEHGLLTRTAGLAGLPERALHCCLSFGRLSELVAGASAVVSGDTGIAHLAVAHGTASVTLFGPVSPDEWGPPPLPHHLALWHRGPRGDPHGRHPDPLLLRIQPEQVLAALDELPEW